MSSSSSETPTPTQTPSFADDTPELSRAASYTDLPSQTTTEPSLRRTFSDYAVPALSKSPTKETVAAGKDILRRTSQRSKDKPATISRFTLSSSEDLKDPEPNVPETKAPERAVRPSKGRSMSGRIVSLARKPWGSSSRSPSPSAKRSKQQEQSPTRAGRKTDDDSSQPSRRRTILYKRPRRPMVAVVAKGPEDGNSSPSSPSGNSLRHKSSFEKFTASLSVSTPVLPPMPKGAAETAAAYANTGGDPSRKKDELWGVFRGLEADYQK
jgi:hypothetical protein